MRLVQDRFDPTTVYADLLPEEVFSPEKRGQALAFALDKGASTIVVWYALVVRITFADSTPEVES